jgi:hypothetical protein
MSDIFDKTTSRLSIEGTAESIISALQAIPRGKARATVQIRIPVRDLEFKNFADFYTLPVIEGGKADEALDTLRKLLHQTRITAEQHNDLIVRIEHIASLTR